VKASFVGGGIDLFDDLRNAQGVPIVADMVGQ
jgi:hypothetical protein